MQKKRTSMRIKWIIIGFLVIIVAYVSIDFYKQNESHKLDKKFRVLQGPILNDSSLALIGNLHKTNEFKIGFLSNMTRQVKVNRHFNLIDYFFPKKLENNKLIDFYRLFNDSTNFDIGETTYDQVDYVIRFYDSENELIFKMWIGLDCKMIDSEPNLTNIKTGHLTKKGLTDLKEILEK